MAENFEFREDYIDMQGYQAGIVQISDERIHTQQSYATDLEYQELCRKKKSVNNQILESKEREMLNKLQNFGKKIDDINHSIGAMAQRHDERFQMIMGSRPFDSFQRNSTFRTFDI